MVSDPLITTPTRSVEEIRLVENQLKKVLASKYFKSAKKMQCFLKYVVDKTIAGEERALKQYTIGVDALLFSDDFNPDENPAVRIMGGRVRERLQQYYETDRADDQIVISIPKGGYIPEFKKNTDIKKTINQNLHVSHGPTLALTSFSDRTQNSDTNRLLLQCSDTLATELSRFLCLKLVVCNPFGDKEQSHLAEIEIKSSSRAEYILALFFQKMDSDEVKYRLVYRLVLVNTGEVLWSENYVITGDPINEQKYIIGKITATVADHLQGMMHTHWSRNLLVNLNTIPDDVKVLVYFRNYTDNFTRDSFEKAVNACLEALERNPNDIVANLIYAAFCRREYVYGRGLIESPLKKGKKSIETALRLSPNSHEVRFVNGLLLFCQNDWERSIEEFELARSISKNNIVVEFGIGFHLCKMNQWDKGLELVNNAMLLSTNYPSYYHMVPCLDFYRQEKYVQALHEARKITMPGLVHGILARCICYTQLGELDKAEKELQEIINRCPNFMQKGRAQVRRYLGEKTISDKVWDGILKVSYYSK